MRRVVIAMGWQRYVGEGHRRLIARSVRLLLERNRVLAEGAGAASVAAALNGKAGTGQVVCVVSGGNLDAEKLIDILESTGE